MSRLRSLLTAAALLLPLPLLAQPVAAPTAFDRFMGLATGAGKTTVSLASNGTPLASPGVPTLTADGGLPKVETTGHIRNPSGNPVPVTATARVPAAEVSKAVGRGLGRIALKAAAVVGVGLAVYDMAKEINYILSRTPDGSIGYELQSPASSPVTAWSWYGSFGIASYWDTKAGACASLPGGYLGGDGYCYVAGAYKGNPGSFTNRCVVNGATTAPHPVGGVCNAPPPVPATQQQFLDAVAAKSGWPAGSAVSRVLAESSEGADPKVQTGPMTVTGPATTPGAQRVTQNVTNNTTKTETTTHNHTYQGDTVTTNTVVVTNLVDNSTGNTISSETKTETPEKEEDPPKEVANDTPLPEQPKLYTPKYPNGLEGVWAQQKANLNSTPLVNLIGKLMPNVGSSGTCPTWSLDLTFAAWADFGLRDFAPPCYVWDWARLIILVSALLLARALIFGG